MISYRFFSPTSLLVASLSFTCQASFVVSWTPQYKGTIRTFAATEQLSSRAPVIESESRHERAQVEKIPLWTSLAFALTVMTASPVWADEYGVEKEAPTLFTGETVMICTKRGPLGACLKTEARTNENDNDKSEKYFKDPGKKTSTAAALEDMKESDDSNALIQKLRQQTVDNKEKNDLLVKQKTMINDQSASFGPFDRQVVIMNVDGRGFTLLENPQAMRLKKDGFIVDRKFVKQPTQDELDAALQPAEGGLGEAILGLFGGDKQ